MGKSTYVAVGNREDISDLITNITPKITPFFSACSHGQKAIATNHEWLEDSLSEPEVNKQVEGFEYTVKDPTPRKRLGNYTQIFARGYGVTATQEVVAKHGVRSEIGYNMVKAMREISRDVELALITQKSKNAGGETTARELGGIPFWIATNVMTAAAERPLTENLMNLMLEKCWDRGGTPARVYLSGPQKRAVSTWNGGGEKTLDQNSKKLINAISVYESDFGVVSFVPHRMMPKDQVYVIDQSLWKVAQLRKMHTRELPRTGDGIKKVIVGELTLEARAEQANGRIEKLSIPSETEPVPEPEPTE